MIPHSLHGQKKYLNKPRLVSLLSSLYDVERRLFSGLKDRPKTSRAVPMGEGAYPNRDKKKNMRDGERPGNRTIWNTVKCVQDPQKRRAGK